MVFGALRHAGGVGDEQGLAAAALDAIDQVWIDLVAAVGKGAPARGDFHRRQGCSAQRQRKVARQVLLVEAELGDVVDGTVHAHGLQQADRHQVARLVQRFTQADRAEEGVGVVLGSPFIVLVLVEEHDWRIVDQAGGSVAAVQCSTIDERLEARAWLALGLHGTVVVTLLEREAADQGADGAVLRVEGDQRTLCSWYLAEL